MAKSSSRQMLSESAAVRTVRSVDQLLPASSYAAIRFGGLSAFRKAASDQPLSQLFEQFLGELPAELREEIVAGNLDQMADEVRRELTNMGIKPTDLRSMLERPMAVGVGRISLEGMGPSVCLLIDAGDARQQINRCMKAVGGMLPRMGADTSLGRVEIAGHALYQLQFDGGPSVFAGWLGSTYCVSNSRGYLREVAAVAAGQQASLFGTTRAGELHGKLGGEPLLAGALNASTIMDALAPHMPYEAGDFADALGVGRLDTVYGGVAGSPTGSKDLFHLGLAGSSDGLLKSLVQQPANLDFASICSENTVVFGAGSFDVPAVLSAFEKFVDLLPQQAQDEMRREMGREFGRELRRMGTSPQELHAMMQAFGSQVGMALSLEKGPVPKPELLMRLTVRDHDLVAGLLQRVEQMSSQEGGVEWRSRKSGDDAIRFCSMQVEGGLMLTPCYLLTNDALWFGSDALGLSRAMKRADRPEQSLAAQPDFAQMADKTDGASGVLYVRAFRGVQIGWRSVETMLYPMLDAQADEIGFGSEALPDQEQMAKALGTTTIAYHVGDDGVTVRAEGSMTIGALLAGLGAMADRVLSLASAQVF
ncbi:MAG: hypothetical protein AB8H80_12600 [Planctomycetota bacterium]